MHTANYTSLNRIVYLQNQPSERPRDEQIRRLHYCTGIAAKTKEAHHLEPASPVVRASPLEQSISLSRLPTSLDPTSLVLESQRRHGFITNRPFLLVDQLHGLLPELAEPQNQQSQLQDPQAVRRGRCRIARRIMARLNADLIIIGRFLIRLSRPRHIDAGALCAQENQMPVWPGVGRAGPQGGRSLQPVFAKPEHHPQHRSQRRV